MANQSINNILAKEYNSFKVLKMLLHNFNKLFNLWMADNYLVLGFLFLVYRITILKLITSRDQKGLDNSIIVDKLM